MTLSPTYLSKPLVASAHVHFDLTDLIKKKADGKYKVGDQVSTSDFMIGDYVANFDIYPSGVIEKCNGEWSLFLVVKAKSTDDYVFAKIHCDKRIFTVNHPIQAFAEGFGRNEAFTDKAVAKKKSFDAKIKIFNDAYKAEKVPFNYNNSYLEQQELIYTNSKINGDITLIIKEEVIDIDTKPKYKRSKNNTNNNDRDTDIDDNDGEMKCSSLILRSASKVFAGMFDHDFKENNDKKIIIQAMDKDDVDDMYYYICTNELREDADVISLIKLAHLYDLKSLFNACVTRIITTLSVENYVDAANTFNRYEIDNGYNKLIEFGKENLEKIKKEDNFTDLSFTFKYAALGCTTEETKELHYME